MKLERRRPGPSGVAEEWKSKQEHLLLPLSCCHIQNQGHRGGGKNLVRDKSSLDKFSTAICGAIGCTNFKDCGAVCPTDFNINLFTKGVCVSHLHIAFSATLLASHKARECVT